MDANEIVLLQLTKMPDGGGYATTREAHAALASSAQIEKRGVVIRPSLAKPSYCSGATYLVFLKTLGELQRRGGLYLSEAQWEALLPSAMPDGHGIWGRWNANGPGTARLFHELGIGNNFTSYENARPGDFMKIFWTDAVGKHERGHLVVFLGTEEIDGEEHIRFWSSNKPLGYGQKSVARSKIAKAIFSRLENWKNLTRLDQLPASDPYLAGLLTKESSFTEACRLTGAKP
jgi:hypothetical protein